MCIRDRGGALGVAEATVVQGGEEALAQQPCKGPESHPHYGQYSGGAAGCALVAALMPGYTRFGGFGSKGCLCARGAEFNASLLFKSANIRSRSKSNLAA